MKGIKSKYNRGFVALFAVLISSIVLTITMGILQIALKELLLSSTGRESQFGFYAADAGVECALFWDVKGNGGNGIFPTSTASTVPIPGSGINCGTTDGTTAQDITVSRASTLGPIFIPMFYSTTANSATSTFYLSIIPGQVWAMVNVGKSGNNTIIESYGHNTVNLSDPRMIERGIRVTY